MPIVLNMKLNPPPPYVYVGRPSCWGNPYSTPDNGTRSEVLAKYETWIKGRKDLMARLPELKGKNLACWCSPLPCHADILIKLANG